MRRYVVVELSVALRARLMRETPLQRGVRRRAVVELSVALRARLIRETSLEARDETVRGG